MLIVKHSIGTINMNVFFLGPKDVGSHSNILKIRENSKKEQRNGKQKHAHTQYVNHIFMVKVSCKIVISVLYPGFVFLWLTWVNTSNEKYCQDMYS